MPSDFNAYAYWRTTTATPGVPAASSPLRAEAPACRLRARATRAAARGVRPAPPPWLRPAPAARAQDEAAATPAPPRASSGSPPPGAQPSFAAVFTYRWIVLRVRPVARSIPDFVSLRCTRRRTFNTSHMPSSRYAIAGPPFEGRTMAGLGLGTIPPRHRGWVMIMRKPSRPLGVMFVRKPLSSWVMFVGNDRGPMALSKLHYSVVQ